LKILTVIGARPQFIKAFPVSFAISSYKEIEEVFVHTGQHYDKMMSSIFLEDFNLKVKYNLEVGSKLHGEQTAEMLLKLEQIILKEEPACVLVYGDTNSTLAGALAACKLNVKIAHIEAGLRSFNKNMPEEINRVLVDHVADFLFCPTKTALLNLKNEGIVKDVVLSGDVMVDALIYFKNVAQKKSDILQKLSLDSKSYFLITIHRANNTDNIQRLTNIVNFLNQVNYPIVFPIHPRTMKKLREFKLDIKNPKVKVIEPVGYLDMLKLEANALKIITDSGGIQKEAFILKVPCITIRDETEWVETLKFKANILVNALSHDILDAVKNFEVNFLEVPNIFGDGKASKKIVNYLYNRFLA